MELYPLKVFLTVATERSFSRAGEKLLRTQPAISIAIQRLESDLNPVKPAAHCIHRFEIALGRDWETGFQDIYAKIDQRCCHLQLFRGGHAAPRRLFPVTQGSVKDVDSAQAVSP